MNTDQLFELIRQNGIGQNIKCLFSSEDEIKEKDFVCTIHNYKYNDKTLKIYMDQYGIQEHKRILEKFPNCRLLIQKKEEKQTTNVTLFCKFVKAEKKFIYVRIYNIKYPDDNEKTADSKI
jgi:hypothetical protein